jgi:hypothetical protein
MAFAEEDELVETLVLDGFHKSLGVRIAIGAPRWNLHAFHASRFQDRRERLGEQWIPVVEDRRRDHGDEKLKLQRRHWSPSCPFRPADSSCASP